MMQSWNCYSKLAHDFFKGIPAARKLTSVQWCAAIVADLLRLYTPPIVATQLSRQRHSADVQVAVAGHVLVTKPHYADEIARFTICKFVTTRSIYFLGVEEIFSVGPAAKPMKIRPNLTI
jgi:hypothetical protein